jgi:hypothetical protein
MIVDLAVSFLQVLVCLLLAYGAYLAIYRRDLWPGSPLEGARGEAPGTEAEETNPFAAARRARLE